MNDLGEWDSAGADDPGDVDELEAVDQETGELLDTMKVLEEDPAIPPLYYGSVDEFVREMIVPVFRRRVGDRSPLHWSAHWWRYPEAVIRLEALWRAWEHLRLDPETGMSVWLRDHADHHLPILLSDYGPFGKSQDSAEHGEPLPYAAPPDGLFCDVRANNW